jgi:hypothetical protein
MAKRFETLKYRRQNQVYGVPVRWWRALPCECVDPDTDQPDDACNLCEANGRRYVEQQIKLSAFDGNPSRVLVGQTKIAMVDAEFGSIKEGSTQISVMPDEIDLARLDRVSLIDPGLVETVRQIIERGEGLFDAVERTPVVSISLVIRSSTVYVNGRDFASHEHGITWLTGPDAIRPPEGVRYIVETQVRPVFTVLDVQSSARQSGSDGGLLPREFVLTR